ncbi:Uncharacterised protein [Rikenella microfusus]|uniref:Uncharacterized protein n=1 Tax=Rikenella microfusus TaxID=28139 RepID=A0A379MSQ7_9BACT|nr:Uncharacterised protein [Rikenella microfusus]
MLSPGASEGQTSFASCSPLSGMAPAIINRTIVLISNRRPGGLRQFQRGSPQPAPLGKQTYNSYNVCYIAPHPAYPGASYRAYFAQLCRFPVSIRGPSRRQEITTDEPVRDLTHGGHHSPPLPRISPDKSPVLTVPTRISSTKHAASANRSSTLPLPSPSPKNEPGRPLKMDAPAYAHRNGLPRPEPNRIISPPPLRLRQPFQAGTASQRSVCSCCTATSRSLPKR